MSGKQSLTRFTATALLSVTLGAANILPIAAQGDLIPVSSLTGGSSVFVFRNTARQVRRNIVSVKPVRTKAQRMESVVKIKRQYETLARTETRRVKERVLDPGK